MKIRPGQFIAGLLAAKSGELAGAQAARQEQEQQERAATERIAALLPSILSMQQQQREQALEPYRLALNAPGQTPESQQTAYRAYAEAARRQGSGAGFDPNQLLNLYRGIPGQQGNAFRRALGGLNLGGRGAAAPAPGAPAGASPSGPSGAVPVPEPQFEPPGAADTRASILQQAAQIQSQALAGGNADVAAGASNLIARINQRQIDPGAAATELQGLISRTQAKTAAQGVQKRVSDAMDWLDASLKSGQFAEQHRGAASALAGELASIDTSTPEGLAAANAVLAKYKQFRTETPLQPTATERYNADLLDERKRGAAITQNEKLLDNIARSKTPEQFLANVRIQHQYAKKNGMDPYEPDQFVFEPQPMRRQVMRPGDLSTMPNGPAKVGPAPPAAEFHDDVETPGEVRMRNLESAAKYLQDPAAKEKASRDLYKQYLGFLKSETYASLPEEQQSAWLEKTNALGQVLGAPEIPQLHPGVSPNVRARVEQQEADRKLREKKIAADITNAGKRIRLAEQRMQKAGAAAGKLPPEVAEYARQLRSKMSGLRNELTQLRKDPASAILNEERIRQLSGDGTPENPGEIAATEAEYYRSLGIQPKVTRYTPAAAPSGPGAGDAPQSFKSREDLMHYIRFNVPGFDKADRAKLGKAADYAIRNKKAIIGGP